MDLNSSAEERGGGQDTAGPDQADRAAVWRTNQRRQAPLPPLLERLQGRPPLPVYRLLYLYFLCVLVTNYCLRRSIR